MEPSDTAAPVDLKAAPAGDALGQAAVSSGHGSSRWTQALFEIGGVDRAAYEAVARSATPSIDGPIRMLSQAANRSRLWLAIAALLAVVGGRRGRRAALEGVIAIGATSAVVNLGFKRVFRRTRPDRDATGTFTARLATMPTSTSFPSGHSASAFAFAHAAGRHLPIAAVPLRLLAGGVAYSRVHVGVHYPGDVVIGSIIGGSSAVLVGAVYDHLVPTRFS